MPLSQIQINSRQKERRAFNNNKDTRKYEKTKKGFLIRTYRNMKSRIEGVQHKKAHLYLGKCLLPKEDFYNFALKDTNFNKLFDQWESLGYIRKFTPSIDRINSNIGYQLINIQWITHSENSAKSGKERAKLVLYIPENKVYSSATQLADKLGVCLLTIRNWIKKEKLARYLENSKFKGDKLNGAFCSDYDQLILDNPQIKHICSGHTHEKWSGIIEQTQYHINPIGYRGEIKNNQIKPYTFTI